MTQASSGMFLSGDLHNMLRGLAVTTQAMPAGEFRRGYESALLAVAVAVGLTPAARDEPPPRRVEVPGVFHDLTHENVPFPFAAFARMEK